jgi:hypothetical protein
MAGPMQKAKRGDPLVIPAATFNTFIDVARDFQGRQRSTRGAAVHEQRDSGIVLVRNDSGADRERFDVLGISGVIITPAANLAEFKRRPALVGEVPAAEHRGRLVVLAEPLPAGAIGRAYAAGVCIARVDMLTAEQATADVKVNDPAALESSSSGALQILWVEAGTGVKWAVVRFGGGGGGEIERMAVITMGPADPDWILVCSRTYWTGTEWAPVPDSYQIDVRCTVLEAEGLSWNTVTPRPTEGMVLWAIRAPDGVYYAIPTFVGTEECP